jgi:hypothetical protein
MSRASVSSVTKEQPSPVATPNTRRSAFNDVRRKVTTKHGWLGDYDYRWLCLPSLPTGKSKQPPFYGLHDELPLVLAMASGLQHALAMLAGLITPPIIFASSLALDPETSSYLISASLIGCGASDHQVIPCRADFGIRHSKFSSDVTHKAMERLLPWYWAFVRSWDEFCYAQYCKCCTYVYLRPMDSVSLTGRKCRYSPQCTTTAHALLQLVQMAPLREDRVQMLMGCFLVSWSLATAKDNSRTL